MDKTGCPKKMNQEIPAYRKKSKTASTSNSEKRSDHKHQYEKIILRSFIGYQWGKKCSVCGRIDDRYSLSIQQRREFMKPVKTSHYGIGLDDFLSIPELRQKFPEIEIYEMDSDSLEYRKIEDKGE